MTRRHRTAAIVIALLVAAGLPAAAEDLTIVSRFTAGKGEATTSTQYISAGKIRTGDERYDTIIDIESGRMIHIDHKKKVYYETTLEEMRQHFAELERMLQDNPMLAKMFGGATAVEVKKESGSRTIAGYSCDPYLMTMGDKLQFEIWAAKGLKAPYSYYDAKKMAFATMGPAATRFERMWEEMKKIDGFPLATKMESRMMGINMVTDTEATEVRQGPIPEGTFEPPAGFKQKKSPYQG